MIRIVVSVAKCVCIVLLSDDNIGEPILDRISTAYVTVSCFHPYRFSTCWKGIEENCIALLSLNVIDHGKHRLNYVQQV